MTGPQQQGSLSPRKVQRGTPRGAQLQRISPEAAVPEDGQRPKAGGWTTPALPWGMNRKSPQLRRLLPSTPGYLEKFDNRPSVNKMRAAVASANRSHTHPRAGSVRQDKGKNRHASRSPSKTAAARSPSPNTIVARSPSPKTIGEAPRERTPPPKPMVQYVKGWNPDSFSKETHTSQWAAMKFGNEAVVRGGYHEQLSRERDEKKEAANMRLQKMLLHEHVREGAARRARSQATSRAESRALVRSPSPSPRSKDKAASGTARSESNPSQDQDTTSPAPVGKQNLSPAAAGKIRAPAGPGRKRKTTFEVFFNRILEEKSLTDQRERDQAAEDPSKKKDQGSRELLAAFANAGKATAEPQRLKSEEPEARYGNSEKDAPTSPSMLCSRIAQKYGVGFTEVQRHIEDFMRLDVDGNGMLSYCEFTEALRRKCSMEPGQEIPPHLLSDNWTMANKNQDDIITFEEYFVWMLESCFIEEVVVPPSQLAMRQLARELNVTINDLDGLKKVFDRYDKDRSGMIEKAEFTTILCEIWKADPRDLTHNMFNRMWSEVDLDRSGFIDFEEFAVWFVTMNCIRR